MSNKDFKHQKHIHIDLPIIGKHIIVFNTLLLAKQQEHKGKSISDIYLHQWKYAIDPIRASEIFADIIYAALVANAQLNQTELQYTYSDVFAGVEDKWMEDPMYFNDLQIAYANNIMGYVERIRVTQGKLRNELDIKKNNTASSISTKKQLQDSESAQ